MNTPNNAGDRDASSENDAPGRSSDPTLQALFVDYEASREDDRNQQTIQVTLFSVTLAAFALTVNFLTQDWNCRDPATGCQVMPDPVLALLPLLPFALVAYLTISGSLAIVRSFYLRVLERAIRSHLPEGGGTMDFHGLPVASEAEVASTVTSFRRSSGFRTLALLIFAALAIAALLTTVIAALLVSSTAWRLLMLLIYGAAAYLVVREVWRNVGNARASFVKIAGEAAASAAASLEPVKSERRTQRSLGSYLLWPRPDDAIKMLYFPITYVLASLTQEAGTSAAFERESLWRAFVLLATMELLIYAARYQWNDLRGMDDDLASPQRRGKGRLPFDPDDPASRTAAVRLSMVFIFVRLFLVLVVAVNSSLGLGTALLVITLSVFAVAGVYEWLRTLRVDPKDAHSEARIAWATYAWVGLGYAIRGLAGFWAAETAGQSGDVAMGASGVFDARYVTVAAFLALFGSSFVTITWVLDASNYCLQRLEPYVDGTDLPVRPPVDYVEALVEKPHLTYLLGSVRIPLGRACQAPLQSDGAEGTNPRGMRQATDGALSRTLRPADLHFTPQGMFAVLAGAAAGLCGVSLTTGDLRLWLAAPLVLAPLGAAMTWAPRGAPAWVRLGGNRLLATGAGLACLALIAPSNTTSREYIVLLFPWLVFASVTLSFRAQSYDMLKNGFRDLLHRLRLLVLFALAWAMGQAAADAARIPSRSKDPSRRVWGALKRKSGDHVFVDESPYWFFLSSDVEEGSAESRQREARADDRDQESQAPNRVIKIIGLDPESGAWTEAGQISRQDVARLDDVAKSGQEAPDVERSPQNKYELAVLQAVGRGKSSVKATGGGS